MQARRRQPNGVSLGEHRRSVEWIKEPRTAQVVGLPHRRHGQPVQRTRHAIRGCNAEETPVAAVAATSFMSVPP
jgi:hypothetical protein